MQRKILLGCGVLAAVWWVAMDVVGSLRYPGYSYVDQTISELSAEGAPTKTFMLLASGIPYVVLMGAFAAGIWLTAGGRRAQRVTAALVLAEVIWGFVGGLAFPMAIRGHEETLRNQMHGWYGIGMPILFVLAVIAGSRLLGRGFRLYSYATLIALLVSGSLTAMQAPHVPANEPRPGSGSRSASTPTCPCCGSWCWRSVSCAPALRSTSRAATTSC
jgi:hypothetical protein